MRRFTLAATCLTIGFASIALYSQTRPVSNAVVYEGSAPDSSATRSAPVDSGAFLVQNGRIAARLA